MPNIDTVRRRLLSPQPQQEHEFAKVKEFYFANMRSGRKQRVWEQQMLLLFYFIVIGKMFLIYLLAMH